MAEHRRDDGPQGDLAQTPEHFKREGPHPAAGDTGDTVEEMNEAAADSLINNVEPHENAD